jgi:hypothetical protein
MNVVIIGGGLAGLYAAFLCSHYYPDARVRVCEAHKRLGGRIYTVRKEEFQFEGGAGRIGPRYAQPILWKLMEYLDRKVNDDSEKLLPKMEMMQPQQDVRDIVRAVRLPPGPERSAQQIRFGYDAEFEMLSPQVAAEYIERHFYGPFFSMRGGLEQITHRLQQQIQKKPNVSVHLQKRIKNVTPTYADELPYDKLFVCVEDPSKIHFSVQVPPELAFAQPVELMRVFVQVRGNVPHEKQTGPGPVRMWIPMDPEQGLYQIYADSHWAREWNKIRKFEENIRNTTVQNTVRMFLNDPNASVRVVDFEFWERGVHVWTRPVEKLTQTPGGRVWFAGEVASVKSFGWMEGALDSVRAYFD